MARNIPKRSFTCSDEMWDDLRMATAIRSVEENRDVSISELLRRGAQRELNAVEDTQSYEMPEGYDGC